MATQAQDVEFVDNTAASRYEVRVGGETAGFVTYQRHDGRIEYVHTEVDDGYEGQGLGSKLAAAALDHARQAGLSVTPTCSFIASYVDKHEEYADLLA